MDAARRAGRVVGVLIFVQMIAGGLVNFALEAPLFGAPGFLTAAAPHSWQIGLAALLGLAAEGLWVAVAITAFPILWPRARAMTLWLLALAAVVLAALGLVATALMLTSVGMPLVGHDVVFPLLAPLGLSQLALSLWLIARGFQDQAGPAGALGSKETLRPT